MHAERYWVYILACNNGAYYTGYTTDLTRRYAEHLAGKCKYTRSFKPLSSPVSWQIHGSKADAMKVERWIKKLKRPQKIELISNPDLLAKLFSLSKKD